MFDQAGRRVAKLSAASCSIKDQLCLWQWYSRFELWFQLQMVVLGVCWREIESAEPAAKWGGQALACLVGGSSPREQHQGTASAKAMLSV